MSDWTEIPGRLKDAGFAVLYDRISYAPDDPIWCAKAIRDGREWSTLGENLCDAFLELEKQTQAAGAKWRETIGSETADMAAIRAPASGNRVKSSDGR